MLTALKGSPFYFIYNNPIDLLSFILLKFSFIRIIYFFSVAYKDDGPDDKFGCRNIWFAIFSSFFKIEY